MNKHQTTGERLKLARNLRGVTQTELAKGIGIKQGTIGQLEAGRAQGSKHLPQMASYLSVSYEWLLNGQGDMHKRSRSIVDTETRLIPVRSFTDLKDVEYMLQAPIDWLHAPKNAGANSFALCVESESMVSAGRSYPRGAFIIVDPDKPLQTGTRIVALVAGEPVFREYRSEVGQALLVPLNPQYPTVPAPAGMLFIGTVIGSYLPE